MLKHVLVPLDGSELAETALPYATAIIAENGTLTLLHVVKPPPIEEMPMFGSLPEPLESHESRMQRDDTQAISAAKPYLAALVERLKRPDLTVKTDIEIGAPADIIVTRATALKVDAVVMSTHGRTGVTRWLFGSVTQKVMTAMPCPVFVVPGRQVPQET